MKRNELVVMIWKVTEMLEISTAAHEDVFNTKNVRLSRFLKIRSPMRPVLCV